MKYEKCCRNCEHAYLASCKGCATFGENAFENFELRDELAKIESGELITKEEHLKRCRLHYEQGKFDAMAEELLSEELKEWDENKGE